MKSHISSIYESDLKKHFFITLIKAKIPVYFRPMTFADRVIDFHRKLSPNWKIPRGIELIYPFDNDETWRVFEEFYRRFFGDVKSRTFLFGINPGRFGAGITGVPFTDPKILEEDLGITNVFHKRHELSSLFVYEMIKELGGPIEFYRSFYITSICPLGFITNGKNINYYDVPKLEQSVREKIIENISTQLTFGANKEVAFSIGQGKNFHYLKKLNDEFHFFHRIEPLPHPRWVMQYRRKRKAEYINEYEIKLNGGL